MNENMVEKVLNWSREIKTSNGKLYNRFEIK